MSDELPESKPPAAAEEAPPAERASVSRDAAATAVLRARAAASAWHELGAAERARALEPLKQRVLRRADEIAATVSRECGKPLEEALLAEVLPNADLVDFWTRSAEELLAVDVLELDALSYPKCWYCTICSASIPARRRACCASRGAWSP